MSLGWINHARRERGESTVSGPVPLAVKAFGCNFALKSDFCPCGGEWYISTLCQCGGCTDRKNINYIGEIAYFPENYPEGGAHDKPGGQMYDEDGNKICKIVFTESAFTNDPDPDGKHETNVRFSAPVDALVGGYISAVQHQTRAAQWPAEVNARLYLDGTLLLEEGGSEVAEGGQRWIGQSSYYTSPDAGQRDLFVSDAWDVLHQLEAAGAYALDLVITLTPFPAIEGVAPIKYTVRTPIRVWNLGDMAEIGEPFLEYSADYNTGDSCPFMAVYTTLTDPPWPRVVAARTVHLKGPFDTKEEAEYVFANENWSGMFQAYAKYCSCYSAGCDTGHVLGYNFSSWDEAVGMWALESYGGVGDPHTGTGCDSGWIAYEVTKGTEIVLLNQDGIYAHESGVLAPCEFWRAYSKTNPDPDDPTFAAKWGFSGDHIEVGAVEADCPFCEEVNPPDCLYTNAEWAAIPNNSSELAEYIASLEV